MKKVLYVTSVLGFDGIPYDLYRENKELHREFLLSLKKINALEDVSDVFQSEEERKWIIDTEGCLVFEDKIFTINSSISTSLRALPEFHLVIEEFNKKLQRPKKIEYKEIPNERFPYCFVMDFEDGSENIFFTN